MILFSTLLALLMLASCTYCSTFLRLVRDGNLNALKNIFNSERFDKRILNVYDRNHQTAPYVALECGNEEVAVFLIENGANVNILQTSSSGKKEYPLHLAVREMMVKVIEALLKRGGYADANAKNVDNETPLMLAARSRRRKIPQLVVIHMLVTDGNADTELTDGNGYTALNWAIENGNLEAVKYLLRTGASMDYKDKLRRFPLHHAVQFGDVNIIHALVNKGASLEVLDGDGNTPYKLAVDTGRSEIISYLLHKGANCDTAHGGKILEALAQGGKKFLALCSAIALSNVEGVRNLIMYEFKIDLKSGIDFPEKEGGKQSVFRNFW